MKRMMGVRITAVVVVVFLFGTVKASAEEFPIKPINLYLGFSPGAAGGTTATLVAEGMKKYLKQPVVVNFKPGAAQAIAAEFVKNSSPDGYTLFWIAPADLIAKMAKDQVEKVALKFALGDLESIGAGPYSPFSLTVNAQSPWKSVEDLIGAARKAPGSLVYGSSGAGAVTHLLGELISIRTGIVLNHIPFQGGGPSITALLGGHVQVGFMSVGSYGSHVQPGGGLRTLLVFDKKRDPHLPEVPAAIEKGIDIAVTSWFGLQAPKGLPKARRDVLVSALEKVVNDPQVTSALTKAGLNVAYIPPEETDRRMREELKLFLDTWGKAMGNAKK